MAQKKKGISISGALLGGAAIGNALGKGVAKGLNRIMNTQISGTGKVKTKGRKKKGIFG